MIWVIVSSCKKRMKRYKLDNSNSGKDVPKEQDSPPTMSAEGDKIMFPPEEVVNDGKSKIIFGDKNNLNKRFDCRQGQNLRQKGRRTRTILG